MYSPGGARRGRGTSRGDGYAPTPPWASEATPSPGGKLFLSRTQGPSRTQSPPLLTLLTPHFPHPTPSAHLGQADAALGEGQCEPHPRAAHTDYVLSAPSGPPSPRPAPHPQVPKPGLWGWPQHSARSFSDLVTYRYHSPLL